MADPASVLLSGVIGLLLGIFGGGGSILAVPVLVLVTHLAPAAAVGTSLAMVGTTSLVASYAHHRRGQVIPKVALVFGLSGVLTAFLGARLTALVSGTILMYVFAALMLVVGGGMVLGRGRDAVTEARSAPAPRLMASILAGAGVGLVTGFLGVGGGFLVVPALIAFAGLELRQAVGTSLFVIAINSAAGLAGHLAGGQLNWGLIVVLTTAAAVGALVGERASRQLPTVKLRRGFGLVVIVVGLVVTVASTLGANAVRSPARKAQLLRGASPFQAPSRNPERSATLAASLPYTRFSLSSLTVEVASHG